MMRHKLAALAAAITLTAPMIASAQDAQDFQTWSALLGSAKVDGLWPGARLWFDGHARRGGPNTIVIVRPALGQQLTDWASVWLGYAWVPNFTDDPFERIDEQRIWQQVILTGSLLDGRLHGQLRTRLEQRFHETTPEIGHRIRQFARVDYRFDDSPWGVVVWDELFWGLNDPGFAPQGFDQNRVFVGPMFRAVDGLRLEFGYLNAQLTRSGQFLLQHALALNFFVAL